MLELTKNKLEALKRLSAENGIIGALAIDQRGSLKKMDCVWRCKSCWR